MPVLPVLVALALVAGTVPRFLTTSALWLDEAQAVAIARLPLHDITGALRHDGSPPLYYVLLHGWMAWFGDGDVAVRAFSGLCSLAAVALTSLAVVILVGRRAGVIAALVLVTNPFAIRYATEARMYALIALEVAVALLAGAVLVRRTDARAALPALAVAVAALLYTHYWGLYLVAAAGMVLAGWYWWRPGPHDRRHIRRLALGLFAGGLLWLPWLPTFVDQMHHTGTPWADPATPATVITALFDLNGGLTGAGLTLTLLTVGAAVLAMVVRRRDGRLELAFTGPDAATALAGLVAGTLAVGVGLGLVFGVAFASRYATVVLVPFAMLVSVGLASLPRRAGTWLTAAIAVVGLVGAISVAGASRTQAVRFERVLAAASVGDVVVYCPDQLGPATYRLLGPRLAQQGYPRGTTPSTVDWVDYDDAWRRAVPAVFAARADALAGAHDLWLVVSTNYHGTEEGCRSLLTAVQRLRPGGQVRVSANGHYFENGFLWEFPSR